MGPGAAHHLHTRSAATGRWITFKAFRMFLAIAALPLLNNLPGCIVRQKFKLIPYLFLDYREFTSNTDGARNNLGHLPCIVIA